MTGLTSVCLVLCVVVALVLQTQGATYTDFTKPEKVHGKLVFFCEYKGLKLLPKSKIKDYDDCRKCTCAKGGTLSCVDLASRITVQGQSDCMSVRIGCRNKWVLKSDTTKKCPKKRIPPHGAVGK